MIRSLTFGCLASLLFFVGCSQQQNVASVVGRKNDSNIKRLANLYSSYQQRNGSQGPKDEGAFKDFIRNSMPPHRLELMQVDPDDIDGLFTSERDGEPFEIRYGVAAGTGWIVAIVFEKEGEGGVKQVGFTDGNVEEADDARYRQLLEDAGRSKGDARPKS